MTLGAVRARDHLFPTLLFISTHQGREILSWSISYDNMVSEKQVRNQGISVEDILLAVPGIFTTVITSPIFSS